MSSLCYVILSPVDDEEITINVEDSCIPPIGSLVELNTFKVTGTYRIDGISTRVTQITHLNTAKQSIFLDLSPLK